MSHFISFVLIGIVQVATAVWGGILAIKALPPEEKRWPHLWGFFILGIAGVVLTFWIGAQTYESESAAERAQNDLMKKIEYQNGQLSTIAGMLKINSTDPAVIASALAQALHPPEKLPCLRPVRFTASQRQSQQGGYEALLRVPNPTGIKKGTSFQFFFTAHVNSVQSPDVKMGGGGFGSDIASFTVGEDVPKGKTLTFVAEGALIPPQVKCIDRFDPAQ